MILPDKMAKITHEPSGAELAEPLTTCCPPNLRGEEDGAAEVARVNVRNKPPPMLGVIMWNEQKQQREQCESPNQACPPGSGRGLVTPSCSSTQSLVMPGATRRTSLKLKDDNEKIVDAMSS